MTDVMKLKDVALNMLINADHDDIWELVIDDNGNGYDINLYDQNEGVGKSEWVAHAYTRTNNVTNHDEYITLID